jgi:hypothetical protein
LILFFLLSTLHPHLSLWWCLTPCIISLQLCPCDYAQHLKVTFVAMKY